MSGTQFQVARVSGAGKSRVEELVTRYGVRLCVLEAMRDAEFEPTSIYSFVHRYSQGQKFRVHGSKLLALVKEHGVESVSRMIHYRLDHDKTTITL